MKHRFRKPEQVKKSLLKPKPKFSDGRHLQTISGWKSGKGSDAKEVPRIFPNFEDDVENLNSEEEDYMNQCEDEDDEVDPEEAKMLAKYANKTFGDDEENIGLLPVLKNGKVITQKVTDKKVVSKEGELVNVKKLEKVSDKKETSAIDDLLAERNKRHSMIEQLALLGCEISSDPENNYHKFSEMKKYLHDPLVGPMSKLHSLIVVTLFEIFKEILPMYRIRLQTDKEKGQSQKKETIQTREYEEYLVHFYKFYLGHLESFLPSKLNTTLDSRVIQDIPQTRREEFSVCVIKCFGELLKSHPQFNFSSNVATVLVEMSNNSNDLLAQASAGLLCEVISLDYQHKGATKEIVDQITKFAKKRNFNVRASLVKPFMSLKIKDVAYHKKEEEVEKKRLRQQKFKLLSKKAKKQQKEVQKIQRQLEEAGAREAEIDQSKLQTGIMENVFSVYFRILKSSGKSNHKLLSACLEGLANFAHLINVDFYPDLFASFTQLISDGGMSDRQSLHTILAALRILSGDGAALQIDPGVFLGALYALLGTLPSQPRDRVGDLTLSTLTALDSMLITRRHTRALSRPRLLAFLKRISTWCLHADHHSVSKPLLALINQILVHYPFSDVMLESGLKGSGRFDSLSDAPDHAGAESATLWEAATLQRHVDPAIRELSSQVFVDQEMRRSDSKANNTPLFDKICRNSAVLPHELMIRLDSRLNKFRSSNVTTEPQRTVVSRKRSAIAAAATGSSLIPVAPNFVILMKKTEETGMSAKKKTKLITKAPSSQS